MVKTATVEDEHNHASLTIRTPRRHRPRPWATTYAFSRLFPEASGFKGHPHTKGDVVIGHDVWIGYEALILGKGRIGNGAVVAARSVVTRNVAPYSIVAGNPARHVKFRFDEAAVKALEEIAWWNWPMEKIKEAGRCSSPPTLKPSSPPTARPGPAPSSR